MLKFLIQQLTFQEKVIFIDSQLILFSDIILPYKYTQEVFYKTKVCQRLYILFEHQQGACHQKNT